MVGSLIRNWILKISDSYNSEKGSLDIGPSRGLSPVSIYFVSLYCLEVLPAIVTSQTLRSIVLTNMILGMVSWSGNMVLSMELWR